MKMINGNVYKDYRDNIIIDKDNPVLAFKANRDRYIKNGKQDIYAGLPHIGSINSEDALTWNYIRSICQANDFSVLEKLLKIKIKNPKVLLWTLSFDSKSNDLQFLVGSTIREIDGIYQGQITEPDIIIETDEHLIVIECKLGEANKYPTHLWESCNDSKGPEIRKEKYFQNNLFINDLNYSSKAYQLFRMAYYTYAICSKIFKKPMLVSLTNESWWQKENKSKDTPKKIWNDFTKQVDTTKISLINIFWQDMSITKDHELTEYLKKHQCLIKKI